MDATDQIWQYIQQHHSGFMSTHHLKVSISGTRYTLTPPPPQDDKYYSIMFVPHPIWTNIVDVVAKMLLTKFGSIPTASSFVKFIGTQLLIDTLRFLSQSVIRHFWVRWQERNTKQYDMYSIKSIHIRRMLHFQATKVKHYEYVLCSKSFHGCIDLTVVWQATIPDEREC